VFYILDSIPSLGQSVLFPVMRWNARSLSYYSSRGPFVKWDVFICHASEDKEAIAKPLAAALAKAGLRVWYDERSMMLGDSIRRSIDQGLQECRFGVVILSPHFFAKEWPRRELDGLVTRDVQEGKIILPVWHGVTHDDVARFSPPLADKLAISTDRGVADVVQAILRVVRPEAYSSIDMEFVLIPAGTFLMGSNDAAAFGNEQPVHEVTISQPFYLGKYQVTQAEWQVVVGSNPSYFAGDPTRPVESVSWNRVQEFIRKLNEQEGSNKYRLPTEAEWEYAARAGTTTAYSFGDDLSDLDTYAWYRGNSDDKTHPVGQIEPNAWGLYDMHGNVREWVQDWYGEYPVGPVTDPTGPSSGTLRVVRGGSWRYSAQDCRAAYRFHFAPNLRDSSLGFRLARSAL
jgi:formylglycine-generating enzyme required for sulfatase activity